MPYTYVTRLNEEELHILLSIINFNKNLEERIKKLYKTYKHSHALFGAHTEKVQIRTFQMFFVEEKEGKTLVKNSTGIFFISPWDQGIANNQEYEVEKLRSMHNSLIKHLLTQGDLKKN